MGRKTQVTLILCCIFILSGCNGVIGNTSTFQPSVTFTLEPTSTPTNTIEPTSTATLEPTITETIEPTETFVVPEIPEGFRWNDDKQIAVLDVNNGRWLAVPSSDPSEKTARSLVVLIKFEGAEVRYDGTNILIDYDGNHYEVPSTTGKISINGTIKTIASNNW